MRRYGEMRRERGGGGRSTWHAGSAQCTGLKGERAYCRALTLLRSVKLREMKVGRMQKHGLVREAQCAVQ